MRKIIVAGNWKMNLDYEEAKAHYATIVEGAQHTDRLNKVLLFPPYPYLLPLSQIAQKDFIHLGAQNIASESGGAYTGEVSTSMIKSLGINYTLIGHSERRIYFNENDELLKKKVNLALENELIPIFCCGESLEERKSDRQEEIIEKQLSNSLFHLKESQVSELILAYEPVWAIGTGETATALQAEEMHTFIRNLITEKYGFSTGESMHILYGGSCNSANSVELFGMENVDGGLIGGASLNADEFLQIIAQLNE